MSIALQAALFLTLCLQMAFLDQQIGTTILPEDIAGSLALDTWREFAIVSAAQAVIVCVIVATSWLRFRNQRHRQAMADHSAEIGLDAYDPSIRRQAVAAKLAAPTARLSLVWNTFLSLVAPLLLAAAVNLWLSLKVLERVVASP